MAWLDKTGFNDNQWLAAQQVVGGILSSQLMPHSGRGYDIRWK
jgi:hypothetical protein